MLTDSAGNLDVGDVVRLRRSGVATVTGMKGGGWSYPSLTLNVRLRDSGELLALSALPWDEYELIAQAIDSERDIEDEPSEPGVHQ
jgi:hypothetical protein